MSFSQHIGTRAESADDFTKDLYVELVSRLRELRREPNQAEPSDWKAWILPVASCVVIAGAFFGYVYPQF